MSTPVRTPTASLRVFLDGIIDYAGLFPPASLDMRRAVSNYSRYLVSPEQWALGRFVLSVARLDEFLNAQENVVADPWILSGILSSDIATDLAIVGEFNRKAPGAVMDCVELRAHNVEETALTARLLPPGVTAFFEIAPEQASELLPEVRRVNARAKLRTGGVVEDAFPALEHIAEFIAACAESRVAFKATAGLHHPLRCVRPLTYEANAHEGLMHGFLNLFTASAIAWSAVHTGNTVPVGALATCLADAERANWHFDEYAMTWSGDLEPVRIDLGDLRRMRSELALSFGSCSFDEPLSDLHELDLL